MTKKTHKKTTAKKARRARRTISDRMTAAQELEQATRYLAHVVAELGGHLRFIRNDLHDVANFIRTNVSCQPQVVELAEACDRGWIEYGVGLQAGWLTKAGESKLAELEGLLK